MKKSTRFQWKNMLPYIIVALAIIILVPLDPDVRVGDFEPDPYIGKVNPSPHYIVQDHYFQSDDASCHAWLYLPGTTAETNTTKNNNTNALPEKNNLPVVIMASGFAEQKDFGFDVYAERFVAHGFAVFLFDYRSFGASEGRPRQLVSPKKHVEDWHAAIDYIKSEATGLSGIVNPHKIGLWGMSFGGGHVLTVASTRRNDTSIVSVVAQAPFLKPKASTKRSSKKRGKTGKLRLVLAALQDTARGYLGLPPVVIPILGVGGQLSMLPSTPQHLKAYMAQHPKRKLGGWKNQGPVRGLIELKSYIPFATVKASPPQIPVLLISGTRDAVCPSGVIEEVHSLLPQSRVITRNASHLEIMGQNHAPEVGQEMAVFYAESFR